MRLACCLCLLVVSTALAAPPVISDLSPRGAQQGKAITLTVTGTALEGAIIESTLPASFANLAPREPKYAATEAAFLVELKPDAAPGLYPIRVRTADGISNLMLFSVGTLPEIVENETKVMEEYANDAMERAERITPPVTINGKLRGSERDWFRLRAAAGQRLVFEAEARRAGSAIDPVIRVLDSAGREIAMNDDAPSIGVDARVDVAFPADGDYYVLVHDSKFSAQSQNFYRLKVGAFPYAEGMFPMGWRRGEPVEVELFGGNLPAPVKVRTAALPACVSRISDCTAFGAYTNVALPGGSAALPLPFVLSDRREILEPAGGAALEAETVVNGRIARAGEVDRYRLAVKPGEHWMVELDSAALGTSRLYGVLTLTDGKGKKLSSSADVRSNMEKQPMLMSAGEGVANPYLSFRVPEDVTEITVAVEDLLGRGGPDFAYRLVAEKQPPDFRLMMPTTVVNVPLEGSVPVTVIAERRGYLGPIKLSVANAPDDLLIEGGHIPAESGAQALASVSRAGTLTITPKSGARKQEGNKPRVLELSVWGEGVVEDGPEKGKGIRRRAAGQGMATGIRGVNQRPFYAPWLNLELPAMLTDPRPADLEVTTPRRVRLIQGQEYEVGWKFVRRAPGIRPPQRVNDANVPGVGNLRVLRGETREGAEKGYARLVTTVGTPPMTFDMLLTADVTIDGRSERITSPAVTFEIVQGYSIEVPSPVEIARGGKAELAARIAGEPGFKAPVSVKVDGLPAGVQCAPAEIRPDTGDFRMACNAAQSAAAGEYDVELASNSMLAGRGKENVPYTIPPVRAKVVVR